ncbi:MAG: hemolysin III family protein [Bdellovibrionia bacterium]
MSTSTVKPLLRGHLHQAAFFVAIGACMLLIAKSSNANSLAASVIYSFGLLSLFGVSTIYHRPNWGTRGRAWMRSLDHSAIFLLIAGTFTPICLLALSDSDGRRLLIVVWSAAALGIFQSLFWTKAPKWFTALFCVGVGWLVLPYIGELKVSLGLRNVLLLGAGGVVYTAGAVFYALKKPVLFPEVFGYHELFHLLTIVGAIFHFVVVYQLIV